MREGQSELVHGTEAMSITLAPSQQLLLLDYMDMLFKWNKAYNLTAVREKTQMISRHLLDSLSIVSFIKGKHILDVGSGAGLPGIVLAIYFPDKHVTLVDSNGKKTRFLQTVKQTLKLDNITVIQTRVEKMSAQPLFDCIVSRAFAELGKMVELTKHLLTPKGEFIAMKANVSAQELSAVDKHYKVHTYQVTVPNSEAVRQVVMITKGD